MNECRFWSSFREMWGELFGSIKVPSRCTMGEFVAAFSMAAALFLTVCLILWIIIFVGTLIV